MIDVRRHAEECLAKYRAGTLQENDLKELAESAARPARQGLLYIQAPSTHPHASVVGMSIFEDGKDQDGVDENGNFLYSSIHDALKDGWRIIKFPEMSMAMDDQNTYALGYEFILERYRQV